MDQSTRIQYLEAMGIDVWVPRQSAPVEDVAEDALYDQQLEPLIPDENLNDDWQTLEQEVSRCEKCVLCQNRTQTVFGAGNKHADWMLIGEAPGQNEDLQGQPFVGAAGFLLTEMIRAIGMQREQVYIANILKCKPPDNRDPKIEEVNECHDYLQRQINLVKPKIILAVGRVAAQSLLNTNEPLSKLRNKQHQLNGIPLVVVYHPAYLLRSLLEKRKAWQDLRLATKIYQELKA